MTDKRLVFTTAESEEEARKIARRLVEKRLAACVNIVPRILSIYRWQEKMEETEEWLLIVKTIDAAVSSVCDTIKQLHSYELPECVCIKIEGGSAAYLRWIEENARGEVV